MGLLFYINDKQKVILHPECTKLCKELKILTEDQLLYIINAYDYYSQFHQFPIEDRRRKARGLIYGPNAKDPEDLKAVKEAIDAYKGLQYDSRRVTIEVYEGKIIKLQKVLNTEEDAKDIAAIMKSIKELQGAIKEIQADIDSDMSINGIQGGGKLSFLEQIQSKLNSYRQAKGYAEIE